MYRPSYKSIDDFPEWWVRLDDGYQAWEVHELHPVLVSAFGADVVPAKGDLLEKYEHWKHAPGHVNHAKPLDRYLRESGEQEWFKAENKEWQLAASDVGLVAKYKKAVADQEVKEWSAAKIAGYEKALQGKILIPQPFGVLKNLYEPASGFCISKFMIIIFMVASLLSVGFVMLAKKMTSGRLPKGWLWNMGEVFLLYLRDEVARPTIGNKDADRFMPLLWTIFFFVLGCNVFGMLPFMGAPSSSFSFALTLAAVVFVTVVGAGIRALGTVGFVGNFIPSIDLPIYAALPIQGMIFAIELLGFFIKHGVLAVRLLANMVAGHLVLFGLMSIAFSPENAPTMSSFTWSFTGLLIIVGCTLFSVLELFVAFLQAYIFTFLTSLFIGMSIHKH